VIQEHARALTALLSFGHVAGMGPGLEEIKMSYGKFSAGREIGISPVDLAATGHLQGQAGSRRS